MMSQLSQVGHTYHMKQCKRFWNNNVIDYSLAYIRSEKIDKRIENLK